MYKTWSNVLIDFVIEFGVKYKFQLNFNKNKFNARISFYCDIQILTLILNINNKKNEFILKEKRSKYKYCTSSRRYLGKHGN